jgi:hypothetical protein
LIPPERVKVRENKIIQEEKEKNYTQRTSFHNPSITFKIKMLFGNNNNLALNLQNILKNYYIEIIYNILNIFIIVINNSIIKFENAITKISTNILISFLLKLFLLCILIT